MGPDRRRRSGVREGQENKSINHKEQVDARFITPSAEEKKSSAAMGAKGIASIQVARRGVVMDILSTFHLRKWVKDNAQLFNPPFRTNQLLVHHKDFLVMMLRGPNTRLDFHIEPGDEFFYQVEGEMELVLKPEGERRQVIQIKEGEIFVCPGGLPHSPRRFENTWGLVIERKRRDEEQEEFVWFCEKCDEPVLSRVVNQGNIPSQVSAVYAEFNADLKTSHLPRLRLRFSRNAMAERLTFLEKK